MSERSEGHEAILEAKINEALEGAIVRYQPAESLAVVREPEQVLADAQKAASALMKVVSGKKKQIVFNEETYLESGDWQTVAKFYGVTAKVESSKFVTYGEASGFEAAAVALDGNGRVVSRGEAMCLNDEENWGMRTKYGYEDVLDDNGNKIWEPNPNKPGKSRPKSRRVKIGEEPTPLFQLRSMAQTRACAKALSNLFKWVVVLAGYKPTPAEEMTGTGDQNSSIGCRLCGGSDSSRGGLCEECYKEVGSPKNISGQAASPQTNPPTQPSTGQPPASQRASQSRVGPTKRIPPTPPDNVPGLLFTVKKIEEAPASGKVNARIRVTLDAALNGSNQGVKWVCNYATCWHAHLFEAIRASVGKEVTCAIKESDSKLKKEDEWPTHFIAIEDVWSIDGQEYVEGKPVVQGAK
jgi:hypothetical protein